jgi:hypothetical protein
LPESISLGEIVRHANSANGSWEKHRLLDTVLDVKPTCTGQKCQPVDYVIAAAVVFCAASA